MRINYKCLRKRYKMVQDKFLQCYGEGSKGRSNLSCPNKRCRTGRIALSWTTG